MSTDLEALLRSTLAGRAGTVLSGPQWTGPSAGPGLDGPHRGRRWIAVAAAAAAVVGIGVGAVALRQSGDRTQPAHPHPSVSPPPSGVPTGTAPTAATTSPTSPAPTSSAAGTDATTLASCATTLPAAWTNALQNSVVGVGGRTVSPLAVAPDRSIVALRDDGVTPGSRREVVYAAPNGPASVVYQVPDPDHVTVARAVVDGPWLVLGLQNAPRPPKNTIPGNTSIGLQGIVVVNLENLSTTVVTGTTTALPASYTGPTTQSFAVDHDIVYWDEEKQYGDATGTLKAYALGTGARSNAYTGTIGYVVANAAGVGWRDPSTSTFRFVVRNQLPAAVERSMTNFSRPRLRTDGSSYAWLESPQDVYWWQPGLAKPVHLRLPSGTGIATEDGGGYVSVSGHVLISDSATPMVIDMRTGAVAPFPTTGLFGAARGELLGNAGSVFFGLAFTGTAGHFENGYWADTATSALRVDLAGLPGLSC